MARNLLLRKQERRTVVGKKLTLLEAFKAIRKGEPAEPSEKHPSLAERIAQPKPLATVFPPEPETLENSVKVDWGQFSY